MFTWLSTTGKQIRNKLYENRTTIIVGAVVSGAVYFGYQYLKNKTTQYLADTLEAQRDKIRLESWFESAQATCDKTTYNFLTSLQTELTQLVIIPNTNQLRSSLSSSPEEKLLVWEELKVKTFTRTLTALYSVNLLALLIRTQVNLISRYMYLDNLVQNASQSEIETLSLETKKEYLSMTAHFLSEGLRVLSVHIEGVVRSVLSSLTVTKKLNFSELRNIILELRDGIEASRLENVLLPETFHSEHEDKMLQVLFEQTRTIIKGDEYADTFKQLLDKTFEIFIQLVEHSYVLSSSQTKLKTSSQSNETTENSSSIQNEEVNLLPLARIAPLITKEFNTIFLEPNVYMDNLSTSSQLKSYSLEIFSSFDSIAFPHQS
eukprot:TRINITY_DN630_c0_g1_i1.p1 TRINITY_DN630_c0_g1~~TRINITY_DN630_c0_g1_i1.p1  ORF type:complete len:376 (-),score=86.86 TRINITY_DN630_c0_g1_i1:50-1177(-)